MPTRIVVYVAFFFLSVAAVTMLLALWPDHVQWRWVTQASSYIKDGDTASTVIQTTGVAGTVLAIYAAYREVRDLFPHQKIDLSLSQMGDSTNLIHFVNSGAIISAYQIQVRAALPGVRWVPESYDLPEPTGEDADFGWTSRRLPDGTKAWEISNVQPFFPGTDFFSPPLDVSELALHVRWYTDRNAGAKYLAVGDTLPEWWWNPGSTRSDGWGRRRHRWRETYRRLRRRWLGGGRG